MYWFYNDLVRVERFFFSLIGSLGVMFRGVWVCVGMDVGCGGRVGGVVFRGWLFAGWLYCVGGFRVRRK